MIDMSLRALMASMTLSKSHANATIAIAIAIGNELANANGIAIAIAIAIGNELANANGIAIGAIGKLISGISQIICLH